MTNICDCGAYRGRDGLADGFFVNVGPSRGISSGCRFFQKEGVGESSSIALSIYGYSRVGGNFMVVGQGVGFHFDNRVEESFSRGQCRANMIC